LAAAQTLAPPRLAFERKLFVIRRLAEQQIDCGEIAGDAAFYISSLSSRTIVYKGMLLAEQLRDYFPDLSDPLFDSAIALVHSRFSTNTFPAWKRAHPSRFLAHNGEINTIKGNVNAMRARQTLFQSAAFGDDLPKRLPIIDEDGTDSAMFDNALEFLCWPAVPCPTPIMMMIPEPWEKHAEMSAEMRAFYAYHSALMEPWDGPASMGFSDGDSIGAVLDRNGCGRRATTVTERRPGDHGLRGRRARCAPGACAPQGAAWSRGGMLLVDTVAGRIVADDELKERIAAAHPYGEWLAEPICARWRSCRTADRARA
jgi:glutamate synthase domain-containing protein 1